MNLFIFSMVLIVFAQNLVILLIGWEGVAVFSYLLIGYWFLDPANTAAAKKAFIMNRFGDIFLFLFIFAVYKTAPAAPGESVFEPEL